MMKGIYCLLIRLENNCKINVGKIGIIEFKSGFYIYVGSALNSLDARLKRHTRKEKRIFWHIDYLLKNAKIIDIIYAKTTERIECKIAELLFNNLKPIPNFGSSDCKCKSHLFYSDDLEKIINTAINAFRKLKLRQYRFHI